MTQQSLSADVQPLRKQRTAKRGGLFVNDAELIERLGVPEKEAREAIRYLDGKAHLNFPPKQKLWGDRRFWPAVEEWLLENGKRKLDPSRRDQ